MTQSSQTGRGIFLDLSGRTKLRVTGTDRFRFLNGQITNDLRKTTEKVAIEACVLNAKGKINAHIFVSALGECFSVDAEPELRETLRTRMERYVTRVMMLSRNNCPRPLDLSILLLRRLCESSRGFRAGAAN